MASSSVSGCESVFAGDSLNVVADACVLIVDDQRANATLLERMLHNAGVADVHVVTDPQHVVARFLEVSADLVLLDLQMPGMDGFEVLDQLQRAVSDEGLLAVVVVTSDITTRARDRALQAGAKDFLTKPLDYTELLLRVRNVLESRALYADVQRRNAALQADLDARAERERQLARQRREQTDRIEAALAPDAMHMVFQPIVDLGSGRLVGVEALARFDCEPQRPPNEWFDEAAAVGRGAELELAAAAAALAHFDQLPSEAFLAINISPATALHPDLERLLEDVDTERVVLELTEHARVDDYPPLLAALDQLREQGIRIAVDDTGSGYAGLNHILQLRPQILKLDTTLTRDIDHDPTRRALAAALTTFAAELGSRIIAEGIETADELDTLRELHIAWGQGYHLARPGPTSALDLHVPTAIDSQ